MGKDFVVKYRKLWDQWEVRVCILFSLFLQIFLIFSASFRKQKNKLANFLRPIIWLAYLMADAVAMFALGLLSDGLNPSKNCIMESSSHGSISSTYDGLLAFWAPFLLLHLGGPDAITAFALEDNELWLRHMLWLCVEVSVASYVFVQSLFVNSLWIPTVLMFVAGTIRYGERTLALYLASDDGFKGSIPKAVDPGTNYSKLIDEYKVNKEAGLPTIISIPEEYPAATLKTDSEYESGEEKMAAYAFFTTFKCLISDLLLNFNEIKQSRSFLLNRKPKQAFRIMDIELGFVYDILYTKAEVIHKQIGYICRAICFASVLVSFLLFWFQPKHGILKSDVKITYALLGGAMVLDVVALINLIFSDWTFVFLDKKPRLGFLRCVVSKFIPLRRHLQSKYVTQYNLINSRLFKYKYFNGILREKISELWLVKKILVNFCYTSDTIVGDELMDFIFGELKKKAETADDLKKSKELSSCRGHWALKKIGHYEKFKWTVDVDEVKSVENKQNGHNEKSKSTVDVEEVEFVESILLWHIATDLCYQYDNEKQARVTVERQVSKVISEYMVYLIVVLPSMISSIEGVRQIKFRDACEETMSILKAKCSRDLHKNHELKKSARESLLLLSKEMPDSSDRTKMVLFDACYLVQILTSNMDLEERWKTISEVWAELLAYAASQCRGNYHAKCLSRGGELLTHVWFLMAHLGLGQQYHVVSSHANAKVIVEK